jgi:hypothetical protein
MINEAIIELTKLLIKQDFKDKQQGIEFVKMPKAKIIKENIKLLKLIKNSID